MKLEENYLANFKKRYENLHPLIFHRSVERASTLLELFDILEKIPSFPIRWDESTRSWVKEADITAQKQIKNIKGK